MNFIIIGSAGGLGSYLFQQLGLNNRNVYGLDIVESPSVTSVVDLHVKESLLNNLSQIVQGTNDACSIIISVASKTRLKNNATLASLKQELLTGLSINPSILLDCAESLKESAPKYSRESHIINIGSVLSERFSRAESPIYGASKAASKSLVRDMALSLMKSNICVNSISPALLYRNKASYDFLMERLSRYSVKCIPTPYFDILSLIQFITTSGIKTLRGQDIVLDSGLENIESFDLLQDI